jgi:hypothetical protein
MEIYTEELSVGCNLSRMLTALEINDDDMPLVFISTSLLFSCVGRSFTADISLAHRNDG